MSPEPGPSDDRGSSADASGSTNTRVLDRKRVYVDLPVYDANRHHRKGYVIDITSRGIGLKKAHAAVDDVINWVVCADEHFPVERFSFVAKCRWTAIDKLNNDPLSGFQIIRISPEDSARLRRFLLFLGSRYFKDLTSHLRSEEAVRSEEAQYRSIVESQSELIVRFTTDAGLSFVNQAFCNFVRKDRDELIGSDFFDWAVPLDKHDPKERLSGLTDKAPDTICEFGMRDPFGEIRHFEWIALRFFDDHGTPTFYQLVGRDVTEMKKMRGALTCSGKMQATGTLVAGIAHDVNNALFVMTGYADLALGEATAGSLMANYMRSILKAGQRIKEMVNQILTFSRGAVTEKKPIHLSPLLKETSKYMRGAIPRNVQMEERINCLHDLVEADPTQLYELIVNLVVIARDALIDSGGKLFIGLDNIDIGEVSSDGEKQLTPGKYVRLTIMDTGHGISREVLNQILDPVANLDQPDSRIGIAFPVIHSIVRNHHAYIDVQSELGTGTEFRVYFKVFEQESDPARDNDLHKDIKGFERILFVDDEISILEMSKQLLELMGYAVTTASSGIQALDLLGQPGSGFDLVITDMTMPGINGIQLAAEIRKTHPSLPIVLCSGYTDIFEEDEASEMGISAYMTKPMGRNELSATIRRLLDSD